MLPLLRHNKLVGQEVDQSEQSTYYVQPEKKASEIKLKK